MKRLLLLVPLLMSLQSAAVANDFQSTISERRSWDDFHCGYKTYKDNYQRHNRGTGCSIRFEDSKIILVSETSSLEIPKELIKRVWEINVGTDALTFIAYQTEGVSRVVSIGTSHASRYGWLNNSLHFWLVNAL